MNKRYFRDLVRQWRLSKYTKKYGQNFKFGDLSISIPNDTAFAIKYALIRNKYEMAEKKMISKYITSHMPVIEFGGSLGIISKFIATKLENDTKHIIVEANPNIIDICKKNATTEGRRNSTFVLNNAIAYGSNTAKFLISDNVVCSRIVEDGSHNLEVEVTNLSKIVKMYIDENNYTLIMDIEGEEMNVFKNDTSILKNCSIAIIELHPKIFSQHGFSNNDFFKLAKEAGLYPRENCEDVFVFTRN